jgi:predicted dehydrogenase
MSAINVAIVGCGGIAGAHMGDFYSKSDDVRVVAVVDQNVEAAARFAERIGIGKQSVYGGLAEMLEKEPSVQAVDICTPPMLHAEQARMAAAAGKHVLTEKPLATDYEPAAEAVKTAQQHGVVFMVVQNYRWRPEYVQAKNLIDSNWVGKMTMMTTHSLHDWHAFGADGYRKTMPIMSMLELSIHYIDLFRFLTGSEAVQVFAKASRSEDSPYRGDTFSIIVAEFANGCFANLVTSAELLGARANWGAETIIQGTNGTIWLNRDHDFELSAYSRVFGGYMPPSTMSPAKGWFGEPLECFYRCVRTGEEPPTSGADNLKSLRLVMAAAESARTGKAVAL